MPCLQRLPQISFLLEEYLLPPTLNFSFTAAWLHEKTASRENLQMSATRSLAQS